MTTREVAEALANSRGSVQAEPVRSRQALAVVRAAVETERDRAAPRWIVRRASGGDTVLLCRDELADDGNPAIDGERLADYAEALGRRADGLAQEEPLRPPEPRARSPAGGRAAGRCAAPGRQPPAAARGRDLASTPRCRAAWRSTRAACPRPAPSSSPSARSRGARELTAEQVRDRVAGRYPRGRAAARSPGAGCAAGRGRQRAALACRMRGAGRAPTSRRCATSPLCRRRRPSPRASVAAAFEEVPAERVEAEEFDRRLRYSIEQQHFLALVVSPRRALHAERLLAADSHSMSAASTACSSVTCAPSAKRSASTGAIVLRADAVPSAERRASSDWANLQRLVKAVLPRVQAELAASSRHVLLTNPACWPATGSWACWMTCARRPAAPAGRPGCGS